MNIPLRHCRVCLGERLTPFLSLGKMPPINSFPAGEDDFVAEKFFDLTVAFCEDCSHAQLTEALDPKAVFSDYVYFSSMSDTFVAHGRELAMELKEKMKLSEKDLVAEIASNDGALLQSFKSLPTRILGIEPARNIATVARERGFPTVVEFFTEELGKRLREEYGPARIILGTNVLAHVLDLRDFVRGIRSFLADDGAAVIEVPYLVNLIDGLEFDTIYHEHLSYFRVEVLDRLFQSEGLLLFDAERIPLHGGSLKVFIGHPNGPHERTARVGELIAFERERDLGTIAPYQAFALRVAAVRERTLEFLRGLHDAGTHIAGYGAAAKGNVFLNYCQVGPDLIEFIADRSPHKQGRFTPRNHIPVVAPEEILRRMPDILVIFAWNFADEIIFQQSEYRQRGGKFAMLLLEPRVIL
ncbi:hypothetical protein A3F28_01320 [Candidatus Uhrbacteria bacterium RIFCSPHIGHO2_12_FULL_57_11]|uniref:Methyltransferase n=1 Tax=Candidatus Uhrbacteria bacterium RIFCSPHIGHO2_12_FULL_57_11 TaxID=1802398 RepID=A0A1F7UN58_9BACT|nr:MAG: hypothetical protein A3F28_01320 [Candidatus Uhrbacteria bacterium RIFCSPHIGHO2_12_FULL_57_11]